MNTIQTLTEAIERARASAAQKTIIERRLTSTERALNSAKEKVQDLQKAYQKEARDVEKMNSLSFSSFVATLLNNKAERLEKEELEAIEAKRILDSANFYVEALETEYQSFHQQIRPLSDAETLYQLALKEKFDFLKGQQVAGFQKIEAIESQLQNLTHQQIEIAEAIEASHGTHNHLKEVIRVLTEAKGWSAYDMVGGGMIATMVKRDKMDQAKNLMDGLNHKIQRLNQELSDIACLNVDQMDLDGMRLSDYFFDCFFVDMAVHHRIVDALAKLQQLEQKLMQLKERLNTNLKENGKNIALQQQSYEETIEKFNIQ